MDGVQIVTQIVNILGAGISGLGAKIGEGVSATAQALFFTGTGSSQTMSVYAILVIALAGVSLAIALTSRIFTWLTTLGN